MINLKKLYFLSKNIYANLPLCLLHDVMNVRAPNPLIQNRQDSGQIFVARRKYQNPNCRPNEWKGQQCHRRLASFPE